MKNTIKKQLISPLKKQQGMTMWGLLFTVTIVVFFAYVIMILVPVFSQNKNVTNAMQIGFDNAENLRSLTRNQYVELVQRQLFLNEAHRDLPFKKLIKFSRDKKNVTAKLDYSQVVPLFWNISLKVDFNEIVTETIR